jgi:hypothetical protein
MMLCWVFCENCYECSLIDHTSFFDPDKKDVWKCTKCGRDSVWYETYESESDDGSLPVIGEYFDKE